MPRLIWVFAGSTCHFVFGTPKCLISLQNVNKEMLIKEHPPPPPSPPMSKFPMPYSIKAKITPYACKLMNGPHQNLQNEVCSISALETLWVHKDPKLPLTDSKDCSDYPDSQADLILCWMHIYFCRWFCCGPAQMSHVTRKLSSGFWPGKTQTSLFSW